MTVHDSHLIRQNSQTLTLIKQNKKLLYSTPDFNLDQSVDIKGTVKE